LGNLGATPVMAFLFRWRLAAEGAWVDAPAASIRDNRTKLPQLVYSGRRLATFLYLLLAYSPFGALPAIST
jgi:hypothetical protein